MAEVEKSSATKGFEPRLAFAGDSRQRLLQLQVVCYFVYSSVLALKFAINYSLSVYMGRMLCFNCYAFVLEQIQAQKKL